MEKKEQKAGEGLVYSALKLTKKTQAKFATGWRAGKPYLSQEGNVSPSESPLIKGPSLNSPTPLCSFANWVECPF